MTKCIVCGCDQSRIRHRIDSYEVRECKHCHLAFVDPLPGEAELALYYEKEYRRMPVPDAQGTKVFSDLLAKIRAEVPTGRLLEIGCSWGTFLQEASRQYECVGVEISSECVRFAKEQYGLAVCSGTVEQFAASEPGLFDVVLMRHSLEHTRNPQTVLCTVRSLIRDKGVVIILVPNLGSAAARLLGRYWEWMAPPGHLYYFSEQVLFQLLRTCKFVPFRIETAQGDATDLFLQIARGGFHVSGLSHITRRYTRRKLPETGERTTVPPEAGGSASAERSALHHTVKRGLRNLQSCCKPAFKMAWKLGLGEQLEVWSRPIE